jgi:hypothetical protein
MKWSEEELQALEMGLSVVSITASLGKVVRY